MRSLIKYISLLLFSGLIIPFYAFTFKVGPDPSTPIKLSASTQNTTNNNHTLSYNIARNIAKTIFPVLKSLKSL